MKAIYILSFMYLFFSVIKCNMDIWHLKRNVPSDVNVINLCEGCKLYADVAIKKLIGKKSEDDVYNVLSKFNICRPEYIKNTNESNKYLITTQLIQREKLLMDVWHFLMHLMDI